MIGECLPRLTAIGISTFDAENLRRISMTLHRWHELECGTETGAVERDEVPSGNWYPAINRWHDQTGIAHLIKEDGGAACGSRLTLGGGFAKASDAGTHECRQCARIAKRPGKTYWYNSYSGKKYSTPDRETGALKRLAKVMAKYPTLAAYVQGDPRGASLFILRPGDVPDGASVDSYYSRGIAVYK